MINSQGGRILIGVNDIENKVTGIPLTTKQQDQFILMIERLISDFHPRVLPEQVATVFLPVKESNSNKFIAQLWVIKIIVQQGSPTELYTCDNIIAYERRAANNRLLKWPNEIKEEIQRRCRLPPGLIPKSYKDLDPEFGVNVEFQNHIEEEKKLDSSQPSFQVNEQVEVNVANINHKQKFIIFDIIGTSEQGVVYFSDLLSQRLINHANDIESTFPLNESMSALIVQISNASNQYFQLKIVKNAQQFNKKKIKKTTNLVLYKEKYQQQNFQIGDNVCGNIKQKGVLKDEEGFFVQIQSSNETGFLSISDIKKDQIFENDSDLENQMKIGSAVMIIIIDIQQKKKQKQYFFKLIGF